MKNNSKSIKEKIKTANKYYKSFSNKLKSNKKFCDLLNQYRNSIVKSNKIMRELGVIEICKNCSQNTPGGSCCGKGIEDWYDECLLLTNLLLGVKLNDKRIYPDGCLFLGPKGCTLLARHDFCINYLCFRIKDALTTLQLQTLTSTYGYEIYLYIEIEKILKQLFYEIDISI